MWVCCQISIACLLKCWAELISAAAGACWEDGLVTSYQFTPRPLFVPRAVSVKSRVFLWLFRRGSILRVVLQSSCSVYDAARLSVRTYVRLGAIPAFVNLFPERQKTGSRAGPRRQLHQGQKSNFSAPKNVSSHFKDLLWTICCFFLIFFLLSM